MPKQYGRSDDSEGFAVSKPYGHIGRELRLSCAEALHKRATGQEAEAKMDVILALLR